MDDKLLAWARAVKARQRGRVGVGTRVGEAAGWPPLWVFSDWQRLPDPAAVVGRLPPGLCGVVYRPLPGAGPAALSRLRRVCRARRVALTVSAAFGAPGCGEHRPGGWPRLRRHGAAFATASAHSVVELVRAGRMGADLVFLSPVFATASHPAATALGVRRWAALARRPGMVVLALGGVNAGAVRALPRFAAGTGLIGAAL